MLTHSNIPHLLGQQNHQPDASEEALMVTIGQNEEGVKLRVSDIIITQSQEFCQIVRCFANYSVLVRVLGSDKPTLLKTDKILINLSHLGVREKEYIIMRRRREACEPGYKVSVFSRTSGSWCPGYVLYKFNLASGRLAHGDLWFQIGYYCPYKCTIRYKQLKFDSKLLKEEKQTEGSPAWSHIDEAIAKLKDNNMWPPKFRKKRKAEVTAVAASAKTAESLSASSSLDITSLTSIEAYTKSKTRRPERFPEFDEPKKHADTNVLQVRDEKMVHRSHSCDEIGGQDDVLAQEYRHYSFTPGIVVEEFANSEHDPDSMLIHRQPSCDSLHEA